MKMECQKQEYVLDSKWLRVRKDCLLIDNEKIMDDYYVVEKNDVVLMVALNQNNEIILKTEYRYPIDQTLTEIPGGTFTFGKEDPLEAAKRELKEETGCESHDWILLGKTYDYPTKDTNVTFLYLARNCIVTSGQDLDEFEDLTFYWVPFTAAVKMVNTNEICVNSSANAIMKCAALYPDLISRDSKNRPGF